MVVRNHCPGVGSGRCQCAGSLVGPTLAVVWIGGIACATVFTSGCEKAADTALPATVVAAGGATTQPVANPLPPVVFTPQLLDFGYIMPNADSIGTFEIRNVGNKPLKILRTTSSCQCTTVTRLDGTILAPGQSATLTARIDGRSFPGQRNETVTFVFEGYTQTIQVGMRGEVTLPIRARPAFFNLIKLDRDGADRTGHVVIESLDGRPFNILAADQRPPRFVDFDPIIDEPKSSYVLEWDLTEYADEDLPRWWLVETDHPDCPILNSWVRHQATIENPRGRPWSVKDRLVLLGLLDDTLPVEITVTISNMAAGRIQAVRSLAKEFDAKLVNFTRTGNNGLCTVQISPRPDARGLLFGRIEFIAAPYRQQIDIVGKIRG